MANFLQLSLTNARYRKLLIKELMGNCIILLIKLLSSSLRWVKMWHTNFKSDGLGLFSVCRLINKVLGLSWTLKLLCVVKASLNYVSTLAEETGETPADFMWSFWTIQLSGAVFFSDSVQWNHLFRKKETQNILYKKPFFSVKHSEMLSINISCYMFRKFATHLLLLHTLT